ncbi:hypothetical protein ALFP_2591 [Alcaligenes faecalis]|nr:hypothetical protein ALFP_2591 [Alcaligenes faecalis]
MIIYFIKGCDFRHQLIILLAFVRKMSGTKAKKTIFRAYFVSKTNKTEQSEQ